MSTQGDGGPTIVNFPGADKLPKISIAGIRFALVAVLALVLLSSGVYTIDPEEVGVVLRLGAFVRTTEPGLHFKLPLGIEQVIKVPVQRQLKEEFGFRTQRADVRSEFRRSGFQGESNMLTGDLNTVVVEWVVQYRITDPYKFLFRVRDVRGTFRDVCEAVMREIVGDRTVNEVLTVGRQEIEDQVRTGLQKLADQYETGIRVEQVVLQDVNPPDPVKPSFNQVNQAEQEKQRLINEAQSQYNQVIPRAKGEALQAIQQAEGYALNRVNRANGEATRFEAAYEEYRKAPEVTRTRLYLETMTRILPQAGQKYIIDDEMKGVLPLLNMGGAVARQGGGE